MSRWEGSGSWPDVQERKRRVEDLPFARSMWLYSAALAIGFVLTAVCFFFRAWRADDVTFIGLGILFVAPALIFIWVCWGTRYLVNRRGPD